MSSSSPCIIADLNWFGHIPTYHLLYVRAFLALGYHVVSFSPSPAEIQACVGFQNSLSTGSLSVRSLPGASAVPPSRRAWRWLSSMPGGAVVWQRLRTNSALRRIRARRRWALLQGITRDATKGCERPTLFLPYLDDLIAAGDAKVPLGVRWRGLYLASSELRVPPPPTTIEALRIFRDPELDYVAVLDEGSIELTRSHLPSARAGVLPDVTDERVPREHTPLAQTILRRAGGRPIITLLGHLTPRKGVEQLVALAQRAAHKKENLFFVFAGELEDLQVGRTLRNQLLSATQAEEANTFAHLTRLPSEPEFNDLVRISDVVYARYKNFPGSSNLLTKAALFRRPVIVSSFGCMAERVRRSHTGIVYEGHTLDFELETLRTLAQRPRASWEEACASYYSEHSFETLLARLQVLEGPCR